ncbi:hypothetical protein OSTOST_07098 [Ostertagia ostertagi]
MKLLILLLFAATAAHAWEEIFHPPFLKGLRRTARDEYYKILFNHSLTMAQQEKRIIAWAKKHHVERQALAFFTKKAQHMEEMTRKFTMLINELPKAVAHLTKIIGNKKQTFLEMMKTIHELKAKNPVVYRILKFAMEEFMHEHGAHDHPFRLPDPPFPPHDGPLPWHGTWGQPWERDWNGGHPGGWPNGGQVGGFSGWPMGGENDGHFPGGWPRRGQNGGPSGGWPMGGGDQRGSFGPWQKRRFGGFHPNGPEEFGPGRSTILRRRYQCGKG